MRPRSLPPSACTPRASGRPSIPWMGPLAYSIPFSGASTATTSSASSSRITAKCPGEWRAAMPDEVFPFATVCHVDEHFVPCDVTELNSLLEFLSLGESTTEARAFPRGTLLPDGRLDL